MRTDTLVRRDGVQALIDRLGEVDAERFITLILREPFDYTKWREKNLDWSLSVRELSQKAQEYADSLKR
ncbi:MAG: hypothetical protein IKN43_11445 [Selenomonadaceae bacterium]|nr:hypothetical protein [Selenomonadaceae bacterium]